MNSDDLVERRLEALAVQIDPLLLGGPDARLLNEAAAEIRSLRVELERRKYDGIHTCHDQCQRVACVLRRENEALRSQVEQERARARLEGAEIMREAVEEAIKHATPLDEGAVSWGDGWADTRLAIRAIDPAAILDAHMRGEEAAARDEIDWYRLLKQIRKEWGASVPAMARGIVAATLALDAAAIAKGV